MREPLTDAHREDHNGEGHDRGGAYRDLGAGARHGADVDQDRRTGGAQLRGRLRGVRESRVGSEGEWRIRSSGLES